MARFISIIFGRHLKQLLEVLASKDLKPCLISTPGDYRFCGSAYEEARVCTCISNPSPSLGFIESECLSLASETIDTVQEIRSICSCCSNVLVARYIVKLKYLAVISYLPWSSKVGYSSIDIRKLIPGDFSIPS